MNDNVGILLLGREELLDLLTNFSIGNLDIVLGLTIIGHQGEETIVRDIEQLVFLAGDVGDIHVVGGWAEHCIGKVADAPASAESNVCSCWASLSAILNEGEGGAKERMEWVLVLVEVWVRR